jgi:A/G-specific adenine glycosylase
MGNESSLKEFKNTIRDFYKLNGRHNLPWRQPNSDGTFDAYKIMVSEVMLQQTGVQRVIPKYQEFTAIFPDFASLAGSPQADVIRTWSGLGYNRRAQYLRQAAITIMDNYDAMMPRTREELVRLPGIGVNTAGAILAYAFNEPEIFIETNIRSVFLYHFFPQRSDVSDQEILELVTQTLNRKQPREWYWALMDYGSYLKRIHKNPNLRSKHYVKQSQFQGSLRQLRGQVLNLLCKGTYSEDHLRSTIADDRLQVVLDDLLSEKLIDRRGSLYSL